MTEQNQHSIYETERIEDVIFTLHGMGVDADVTKLVIGCFRPMYSWSPEVTARLDRLEAQYVTPFLAGDPELSDEMLEAIEAGEITYDEAKKKAGSI